jgi:hypothetical protein
LEEQLLVLGARRPQSTVPFARPDSLNYVAPYYWVQRASYFQVKASSKVAGADMVVEDEIRKSSARTARLVDARPWEFNYCLLHLRRHSLNTPRPINVFRR